MEPAVTTHQPLLDGLLPDVVAWTMSGALTIGGGAALIAMGAWVGLPPGPGLDLGSAEGILAVQIAAGLIGLGVGLPILVFTLIRAGRLGLSLQISAGAAWLWFASWVLFSESSPLLPIVYPPL